MEGGMAGYAARKKPSEGVAAELFAKALAIEDPRGTRLVIVTMDLISVPRPLRDGLEAQVRAKYGLERHALLVNASHTHCGPELRASRLAEDEEKAAYAAPVEQYTAQLQEKLAELVGQSLARLDFLRAWAGFAMNRRRPTPRGYNNAPYFDVVMVVAVTSVLSVGAWAQAGAVGGPGRRTTSVDAYSRDRFTEVFRGGELAVVRVDGDGDTDLDLYVYDEDGILVASDTDGLDTCIVSWCPIWTGPFQIVVVNCGSVYNVYTITTN
jgi:hypothetical protein